MRFYKEVVQKLKFPNNSIVKETEIAVIQIYDEEYICLTDMLKAKDGDFFVTDWLRNRNTLEYIGIWEQITIPILIMAKFATIRNKSG